MSRIQQLFSREKARIAYLTAGHEGMAHTLEAGLALIRGGANLFEIGIPFSDPIADGVVIQQASQKALSNGTTVQDVLSLIQKIRERSDVPLIAFSYLNPILAAMKVNFLEQAKAAGLDGLLIVDMPLEESESIREACARVSLDFIYVITPHTNPARVKAIDAMGSGFLYYASRSGTTGMRQELPADFESKFREVKLNCKLPIAVGFGISTREMVDDVLAHADGVVVGSYFVRQVEEGKSVDELEASAKALFRSPVMV